MYNDIEWYNYYLEYKMNPDKVKQELYVWVCKQKEEYKNGTLKCEREKLLKRIDFPFNKVITWEECYAVAKKFYQKYGTSVIPFGYISEGINLNYWMKAQKEKYYANKLTNEQKKLLEAIKINEETDVWFVFYQMLDETNHKIGHLLIGRKYRFSGVALGKWLSIQLKEIKNGTLSEEKVQRLSKLGILDKNYEWNTYYKFVKKYYETYNCSYIPIDYSIVGLNVGLWFMNQIKNYKNLNEEQIYKLKQLNIIWNEKEYKITHGKIDSENRLIDYTTRSIIKTRFNEFLNNIGDVSFDKCSTKEINEQFSSYFGNDRVERKTKKKLVKTIKKI